MQHTAYVKDASGKGIQCVTRPDRYLLCLLFGSSNVVALMELGGV